MEQAKIFFPGTVVGCCLVGVVAGDFLGLPGDLPGLLLVGVPLGDAPFFSGVFCGVLNLDDRPVLRGGVFSLGFMAFNFRKFSFFKGMVAAFLPTGVVFLGAAVTLLTWGGLCSPAFGFGPGFFAGTDLGRPTGLLTGFAGLPLATTFFTAAVGVAFLAAVLTGVLAFTGDFAFFTAAEAFLSATFGVALLLTATFFAVTFPLGLVAGFLAFAADFAAGLAFLAFVPPFAGGALRFGGIFLLFFSSEILKYISIN